MTEAELVDRIRRILIEIRLARATHGERRDNYASERNFDGAAREAHKEEAVRKLLQIVESIVAESKQ
jgi:hypothetical protein